MRPARSLQRWLASLIAFGVVAQFFLAGAGAFAATGFGAHRSLGWALLLASVLELVVALTAARLVRRSAILVVLVVIQAALGVLGSDTQAWFGALHAVNALAVAATAGVLARQAWQAR